MKQYVFASSFDCYLYEAISLTIFLILSRKAGNLYISKA